MFSFSLNDSEGGGGDFLPFIKYDARAGKMFRRDRVDVGGQFSNEDVEITSEFKAIADFENLENGWMLFGAGVAPHSVLVPAGAPMPPQPTPEHKHGVRFMLKLSKECAGDKPIRELTGNSKAFMKGVFAVVQEYVRLKDQNPGKLPVITMPKAVPIKGQNSTNYQPVFQIVAWAPRGDLVFQPKAVSSAPTPSAVATAAAPSTGAKQVEPPKAKETVDVDSDFG